MNAASRPAEAEWLVLRVPREHGFWAILVVVVASALSRRAGSSAAWLVATGVAAGAIAAASVLGPRIRRSAALQVVAAGALSASGIPVQLAAGITPGAAALDACAWTAVFMASALSVRACFARTPRRANHRSAALAFWSIVLPLGLSIVFAELSLRAHATATLLVGAGAALIALRRPTAKHLKPVGISLVAIAVLAGIALHAL